MSLSEIFSRASNYTRSILSRVGDLIILLVVSIIPIVNLIAVGYYGRVVRDKPDSLTPPTLHGFWELFIDGIKALVAGLIWGIPLLLWSLIIFVPIFRTLHWEQMVPHMYSELPFGFFMTTIGAIMALIFVVVGFLISILALMGIVHMFKTGSFGKAFALSELMSIIGRIGFLRYLFWLVVAIVLGTVVGAFGMIPVIGWVVSDILGIILMVFLARSISLMYDSAMSAPASPSTPTQAPTQPPPPPPPPTPQ